MTMATTTRTSKPARTRRPAVKRVSWLALVAATSLGVAHAGTVRTAIKLSPDMLDADGRYRLVVQSYDRLRAKSALPGSQHPRASAQRAVTAEDLARGVRIDLVELAERPETDPGVVVAWVEPGDPDLEFDGRGARPQAGSIYGIAPSNAEQVEIRLNRRA
jgi:hypothetical protein